MKEYIQQLEQIGLCESEATIYVANLELGPSSVIKIAQKASLTRQMVYTLMPSLVEKGLIKEVTNGAKRHFEAISPDILNDRVQKISSQINELIPALKSRQATNNAVPLITVYENPMAMRDWYRHFMAEAKNGDEFLVWESGKYWYELDKEFYQKFIDYKNTVNVKNLVIMTDNEAGRRFKKELATPDDKIKIRLSKDHWNTSASKWIWRDEICYLTIRENATNMIVIKSVDLASIEKFDFYKIWEQLTD